MTDHLSPGNASAPSGEQLRQTLAEVDRLLGEMRARDLGAPRAVAEAELHEAQRRKWSTRRAEVGRGEDSARNPGLKSVWSGYCPSDHPHIGSLPVLARVQEQLTSHWEGNQALAGRTRDQLAQHEAGLMDLREALNRAVGTTREAKELNSRNQERLEEALVQNLPLFLPPLSLSPLFLFLPSSPLPPFTLPTLKPHLSQSTTFTPFSPHPLPTPSPHHASVFLLPPVHSSSPPALEAGAVP